MVRSLIAAIVTVTVMVAVAAMPSRVSPQDPRPPSVQPRQFATLEGQVQDDSGKPLAAAVVDASHAGSDWRALVLSDRDGRFRLERVPQGTLQLTVRKDGQEFTQAVNVIGQQVAVTLKPANMPASETSAMVAGAVAANQAAVKSAGMAEAVRYAGPPLATAGAPAARVAGVVPSVPPSFTSMDAYSRVDPSGYRRVADAPLSTFSIDVDTASYTNVRRFLMEGGLPPADAVRLEEWINYFPYEYPAPKGGNAFRVSTALTTCPWKTEHQLLRVGVRGRVLPQEEPPARNLVFLVDVSGSMTPRDRLPLVKTSLRMLADNLTPEDRIALVVYAGNSGLVLPSTPGDQKARIHEALERLEAGGSTNGGDGIRLAYRTAQEHFIRGGVNRVVLATDGDFNVGVTSTGELTRLVEEERAKGVFLSVLGVGRGNLKDATLEQLADRGNGNYAYIDSLQEARRVLVEQIGATLVTIAKDVKLQVEFNPRHVGAYRLVGYENRALATEDFANDAKDAGEIGAGHTVTALYEIVPPARVGDLPGATSLRYQRPPAAAPGNDTELATVSVRHKEPDGDQSMLHAHAVAATASAPDADTAFASAVAEAGLVLRRDPLATGASLSNAIQRAQANAGSDPGGWRAEFVRLMQLASAITALQTPASPTSEQP